MLRTKAHHQLDMCHGSLADKILLFALPLMASSMLQLLFNAADVIVVGQFAGQASLAAVGSTTSLINLLIALFVGLSVGANVVVARNLGGQRPKIVSRAVHTAIFLALVSGVFLGVFGFIMAHQLLVWMSSPADVIDLSTIYLRIYFLGMPATLAYNFGAAILRAQGDTKRPLYYLIVAGIVNVILNLFTVLVLHMDVAGVASATTISQYISAGLILRCLSKEEGPLRLDLKKLKMDKVILGHILQIGLPAGFQGIVFSLSNVLIQSSINSFGANAMAGSASASQLENFVYTAMNSISQAALSFAGQNIGAQRYDRIAKIMRTCALVVTVTGIVLGALVTLLSEPLLHLFINEDTDPAAIADVIHNGQIRIAIICLPYFLDGLMEVFASMLRGMGSAIAPTLITVVGICGVRILWILTVFAVDHVLDILYLSYPVSWFLTAGTLFVCYLYVHKKLMRTVSAAPAAA